jgi:hypothetical protein
VGIVGHLARAPWASPKHVFFSTRASVQYDFKLGLARPIPRASVGRRFQTTVSVQPNHKIGQPDVARGLACGPTTQLAHSILTL